MATPESKVKAAVVKLLKQYDVYYFFPSTHGYGRSGVPDIVGCLPGGRFIGIECKAGKGETTALQEKELNEIRLRKGMGFVIREDSLPLLELVLKENCEK